MKEVPHAAGDTVEVADVLHLTAMAAGERMSIQHSHFEPGDSYAVPAEKRHGAENGSSEPVRGVAVVGPPRDRPARQA